MSKLARECIHCRRPFTSVSSDYIGLRALIKKDRPDLPWIGYDGDNAAWLDGRIG